MTAALAAVLVGVVSRSIFPIRVSGSRIAKYSAPMSSISRRFDGENQLRNAAHQWTLHQVSIPPGF